MSDEPVKIKMVLVIRRDLKMRRGKEIAQACHAAMGAADNTICRQGSWMVGRWHDSAHAKIVVKVNSEEELLELAEKADAANIGHYLVRDAGRTEVPPDTPTALAIGPDYEPEINKITGSLELY